MRNKKIKVRFYLVEKKRTSIFATYLIIYRWLQVYLQRKRFYIKLDI